MRYADVMVAAVPTANKQKYLDHSRIVSDVFKANGASGYVENWGVDIPEGKLTDLRRAVLAEPDESIVIAWITWPDKAARDAGWDKIMQDERMHSGESLFDGKRLIFGGFESLPQF